ncbi:MAG: hypothetical protein ABR576_03530 [Thermoanaerobaculia bacterium]
MEAKREKRPIPSWFSSSRPLAGAALLPAAAIPAGAADAPAERVTLPILDHVTLSASCAQGLQRARTSVAEIEKLALAKVSVETVLDRWDRDSMALEDIIGPVAILNNVHPDKRVRDAADACVLELSSFSTEVYQNEKLFQRIRAVKASTDVEKKLQKDLLENFEDSGVALPPVKRKRAKQIADELTALEQEFERKVRDNATKLTFTAEEAKGLPEEFVKRVRGAPGNVDDRVRLA